MNWIRRALPLFQGRCPMWMAVAGLLPLASLLTATEATLVDLAVSKGEDIRFSQLTRKTGLSPGQVRDIPRSFQALVIVFQAARNLVPTRVDEAADILDEGLQQASDATRSLR